MRLGGHIAKDTISVRENTPNSDLWVISIGGELEISMHGDRFDELVAKVTAARPAPMPPEVVAVVEAAQVYAAAWVQRSALDERVALLDAVRALPEGWRDGAAPAAVPAELDPAGVERAARAYVRSIGWRWSDDVAVKIGTERAEATVRAYLGDTAGGDS